MRKLFSVGILLFFCCPTVSTANAGTQEPQLIKDSDAGVVNWSVGGVDAVGKAMPPESYQGSPEGRAVAVQDAVEIAHANLFHAIEEIQIDTQRQVCDVAREHPEIIEKLKDMINNAQVSSQKYLTDGTVEVTVQFSLYGGFSQMMLPSDIKQIESVKPVPTQKGSNKGPPVSIGEQGSIYKAERYTGLIVDARGIGLMPALAPRIVDENGEEVFGAQFGSREFAVQQGMVGYAIDLQTAIDDPRVADHPMVMKGLKTRGPGRCDIVVSLSDANRLRSHSNHLCFLKRCRVIVVSDSRQPVSGRGK